MDLYHPSSVQRVGFPLDAFHRALISPASTEDPIDFYSGESILPTLPPMESMVNGSKRMRQSVPFIPYKKRAVEEPLDLAAPIAHAPRPPQMVGEGCTPESVAASILLDLKCTTLENKKEACIPATAPFKDTDMSSISLDEPDDLSDDSASSKAVQNYQAPINEAPPAADTASHRAVTPTLTSDRRRMALPEDPQELNSLHCFVRSDLLELFEKDSKKAVGVRRIGLRCVYCSHLPRRERAGVTMSSFYPKNLDDIYRSVCTWQRIHFRHCRHIGPDARQTYWKLKEADKTRGKTRYWVSSALKMGIVDIPVEKGGICFSGTKE
jgi:hypothetical protein